MVTPQASADSKPKLKHLNWIQMDDGFRITAELTDSFNREIEDRIHSGIPTTFTFYLYFKRMRWYWDNKVLAKIVYQHSVTYDTLRKKYKVIIQKKGQSEPISITTTDSAEEMRRLMNAFEGELQISIDRKSLRSKQHYISLEASLETNKLPEPFDTLLFFMSSDFETKTHRQFLPIGDSD
ncbi:DUF4390 domain-containing protein [bacterium]|nr:DUF4390 domain-containing protein [candidate division CSSED10-310 bacterium]